MQSSLLLAAAIAAELVATSSLKLTDGFTRPAPSIVTGIGYAVAFYLLSLALRQLEVGVVYAIWSGAGTALMAVLGYALFGESLSVAKLLSIALIIVGVIGLNLGDGWLRGGA